MAEAAEAAVEEAAGAAAEAAGAGAAAVVGLVAEDDGDVRDVRVDLVVLVVQR